MKYRTLAAEAARRGVHINTLQRMIKDREVVPLCRVNLWQWIFADPDTERVYGARDVSIRLKISRTTTFKHIHAGNLTPSEILMSETGKMTRQTFLFTESDIKRFLAKISPKFQF